MRYDAVETYAFVVVNLFGVVLEVGEEAALAVFFQHLLAANTNCKSQHYDRKYPMNYNNVMFVHNMDLKLPDDETA